jgi:hypothetical protein
MSNRQSQLGTTSVEFAIVALVFFTVMFALIDFSRLFWDMAALDESTRRGARVAAVCPVNDPYIAQVALFGGLIPALEAQHILVQYLDDASTVVADPAGAGYGSIKYVRVSIRNFQLRTFIPGLPAVITPPSFETTIPSESLGRVGIVDVAC